jgi:phenylalanyl-tRNA synthetase beta chain
LIQELTAATVHPGLIDVYPKGMEASRIRFRPRRANEILGTNIEPSAMRSYLGRLGAHVTANGEEELVVVPPSFRVDISEEIDLIEEVARVHGYNNIETQTRSAIDFSIPTAPARVADEARSHLIGAGWREIMAISLQPETVASLGGPAPIKVLNPVSAEMQALRTSMIPGTLDIVRLNLHRGNKDLRLFEIGKVYRRSSENLASVEDVVEEDRLMMAWAGVAAPVAFDRPSREVDLMDLRGEVDALLRRVCLDKYRFLPYRADNTLTESALSLEINGTYGGWFGEVRRDIAKRFEIEVPIFVGEIALPVLEQAWTRDRTFRPLPRFPHVVRDLAFVVERTMPQGDLEDLIRLTAGPLLESLVLFDAYQGAQTGGGRRSLAYSLAFRSPDHTLTDAEVDAHIRAIVDRARSVCGAELRS